MIGNLIHYLKNWIKTDSVFYRRPFVNSDLSASKILGGGSEKKLRLLKSNNENFHMLRLC